MRLNFTVILLSAFVTVTAQDKKPVKYRVAQTADKCSEMSEHRTGADYLQAANNRRKTCPMDSLTFSLMLKEYEQAIKLDDRLWKARLGYARMLMHFSRFEEAAEQLSKVMEHPRSIEEPSVIELRAESYYNSGQFQLALNDLEKASTLNNSTLLLLKAKTYWKLGKEKDACKEFKKALRVNPDVAKDNEFLNCN